MWHNKEGSYNIFIPISQFQSKGHGQLGISLTSTMRGSYMVLWISPSLRFSRKNQMGCSWEDFPLYSFHDNLLNNDVLQVAGRERPTFISKLLCSRLQFSVGYLKQSSQQAYEMVTMISSMVQIKKAWPKRITDLWKCTPPVSSRVSWYAQQLGSGHSAAWLSLWKSQSNF